jgi:general stress protein YciG
MFIIKTSYYSTYKLLRERAKSRERGRGQRAATSRELRPEIGRESGGQ